MAPVRSQTLPLQPARTICCQRKPLLETQNMPWRQVPNPSSLPIAVLGMGLQC